tara:strand:- start:1850 stop:2065 length:216 start_codon:yes stop_codon:yes gene_type:complete
MSWISEKICQLQNAFASYKSQENFSCPSDEDRGQDLSALKVTELKALAKEQGLKGYTGLRKAELVEMLKQN